MARIHSRVCTKRWAYNIGQPVLVFLMDVFFGCCGIDIVMPKQKFIGGRNRTEKDRWERKSGRHNHKVGLRREMHFQKMRVRHDDDGMPKALTFAMAARKRERIEQGLPVERGIHEEMVRTRKERSTVVIQPEPRRNEYDGQQERERTPRYMVYHQVFRKLEEEMVSGRIATR